MGADSKPKQAAAETSVLESAHIRMSAKSGELHLDIVHRIKYIIFGSRIRSGGAWPCSLAAQANTIVHSDATLR
jgi:hypothetical protein